MNDAGCVFKCSSHVTRVNKLAVMYYEAKETQLCMYHIIYFPPFLIQPKETVGPPGETYI